MLTQNSPPCAVGEKIDYITALERFPLRRNVIISIKRSDRNNIKWRYKKYHNDLPSFLFSIKSDNKTYYQNPSDYHEIDNWKCRRIFCCNSHQFKQCIEKNECIKNSDSLYKEEYKNYIVANSDKWQNTESLRITLEEICREVKFNKEIVTPCNQHNALRFDEYKKALLEYIERRNNTVITYPHS